MTTIDGTCVSTLTVHYPEVDIMVCAFARILLSNSWPAILYLGNCQLLYNYLQHMVCIKDKHTYSNALLYLLDILSKLYRGTTILKPDDQNLFSGTTKTLFSFLQRSSWVFLCAFSCQKELLRPTKKLKKIQIVILISKPLIKLQKKVHVNK